MLDISNLLEAYIYAQWTETDPVKTSITFKFDEFDPNDPKLQMLFENGADKKTWLVKDVYRIEHSCKISIFVRPPQYLSATITAFKTTFLKMKIEIDRILNLKWGISGITNVELTGWKDIGFEVGKNGKGKTGKEPITFVAEQVISTVYYIGVYE